MAEPASSSIVLSIIIVSYNTSQLLADCLRTLEVATRGVQHLGASEDASLLSLPLRNTEVIVIDNDSTDDTVHVLSGKFPWIRLIQNSHNAGFARANNQGLAEARGQYVLLLNSDTLVQPDALTGMVEFIVAHPSVGIVGAGLLNGDGSPQLSWSSFPSLPSELLGKNIRKRQPLSSPHAPNAVPLAYETDWVGGACLLARSEAIRQVGGLDESFFMYSEEVDWCFRMKQRGWKVVLLEDARVVHLGGGSADRATFEQMRLLYDSKIRFFEKHYGHTHALVLRYGLALVNSLGIAWRWLKHHLSSKPSSQPTDLQKNRLAAQQQVVVWLLGN